MRHILAALILGAALASASAAFAGDDLNGFPREDKTAPSAVVQSDTQIAATAGSEMALPWWTEKHFENYGK